MARSPAMKIRAAVLERFGEPLVVQDVELAGPKAGEVLVRLHACGVCHTDMYTASGVDPSGYSPCVLGHEGAGVVEAVGEGVTSVAPGDHVVTLFSPAVRRVRELPLRQDEHLRRDPRAAERGLPARRHDAAVARRRGAAPLHGLLDVRRGDGDARRSRWRRSPPRRRSRPRACSPAACRPASAPRCTARQVEAGSTVVVFGAGMVGLGAVAGARLQGAERIIGVDLSEERLELAKQHGATDALDRRRGHRRPRARGDRRLRRGLHVRGDRPRRRHAPGGRVGAHGLGRAA